MRTCNCLNEMIGKLKEKNIRLVGYMLIMPSFIGVAVIKTEWAEPAKAPKGQKNKCPGVMASHCPFCGVKYQVDEPVASEAAKEVAK